MLIVILTNCNNGFLRMAVLCMMVRLKLKNVFILFCELVKIVFIALEFVLCVSDFGSYCDNSF